MLSTLIFKTFAALTCIFLIKVVVKIFYIIKKLQQQIDNLHKELQESKQKVTYLHSNLTKQLCLFQQKVHILKKTLKKSVKILNGENIELQRKTNFLYSKLQESEQKVNFLGRLQYKNIEEST